MTASMTNAEILAAAGITREWAGQWVRREWDAWAAEQPDCADHPHWRTPWVALDERDREVDRRIGETLFCEGWRRARPARPKNPAEARLASLDDHLHPDP